MSDPLLDEGNIFTGGSINATFVDDEDTFGRTLQCSKVSLPPEPPLPLLCV